VVCRLYDISCICTEFPSETVTEGDIFEDVGTYVRTISELMNVVFRDVTPCGSCKK
jgi:hypothetical protein